MSRAIDNLTNAMKRPDQAGKSTFSEFLDASWRAGVTRYDVDLEARTVSAKGCKGSAL